MRHQLGTEVTDGQEVIGPFNQHSVFVVEHWQAAETNDEQKLFFFFSEDALEIS